MNDQENAQARAEAIKSAPETSSADRARFWAGLNRYLAAEARRTRWTPRRHPEPSPDWEPSSEQSAEQPSDKSSETQES